MAFLVVLAALLVLVVAFSGVGRSRSALPPRARGVGRERVEVLPSHPVEVLERPVEVVRERRPRRVVERVVRTRRGF